MTANHSDRLSTAAADTVRDVNRDHGGSLVVQENLFQSAGGKAEPKAEPTYVAMNGTADMAALYGRSVRDSAGDKGPPQANTALDQSRDSISRSLEQRFRNDPQHLSEMRQDMASFERRMASTPGGADQIARTYEQINQMLNAKPSVMSAEQRGEIAGQLLHNLADPAAVRQGWSTTCEAASIETRLLMQQPASVAALMNQMTTTGKFHTSEGLTVSLDRGTLLHNQHGIIPPEYAHQGFGERNQTDQIFQATMRNIELEQINNANGNLHIVYKLGKVDANHPTGEYVIDETPGQKPEDVTQFHQGMYSFQSDISGFYRQVSGAEDPSMNASITPRTDVPDNIDSFKQRLQEAQRTGSFPMTVGIDSNQEPFASQMHVPPGEGALHAITILGVDRNGNVEYLNSYFGDRQFTTSPEKLLDAMHIKMTPSDVPDVAKAFTDHQFTDQQAHDGILGVMQALAPSQRAEMLEAISKAAHRDLGVLLTNEEMDRLGMRRNVFQRVGRFLSPGH